MKGDLEVSHAAPHAVQSIMSVRSLEKRFTASGSAVLNRLLGRKPRTVHAVRGVSFEIKEGRTFALVGESGCGKSTIARCLAGVASATSGTIEFLPGKMAAGLSLGAANRLRKRNLQMVFQDPTASLNPRWRVGRIVSEPIVTHGLAESSADLEGKVASLLTLVGLPAMAATRFPHEFSGGQRQRISIARALASNPKFIIFDEPTSALDVSVQAQILNLMRRVQQERKLAYLLITHNLAVVSHMADEVGVMYLGQLVEQGNTREILTRPRHPYTRLLMECAPQVKVLRRSVAVQGEVPSPLSPPTGCSFHPRCPFARPRCAAEMPAPLLMGGVTVACHGVEEGRIPAYLPPDRIATPVAAVHEELR